MIEDDRPLTERHPSILVGLILAVFAAFIALGVLWGLAVERDDRYQPPPTSSTTSVFVLRSCLDAGGVWVEPSDGRHYCQLQSEERGTEEP